MKVQASADFIAGGRFGKEKRPAFKLLNAGLYDYVASDAHTPAITATLKRYARATSSASAECFALLLVIVLRQGGPDGTTVRFDARDAAFDVRKRVFMDEQGYENEFDQIDDDPRAFM